nr:hypothetical protein [Acidimicrobiia bacterium]
MAVSFGPPSAPTDPVPSWAPSGGRVAPAQASPAAQAAVFATCTLAIGLTGAALGQLPSAVVAVGALAVGVALGLATGAARIVEAIPGLVVSLLAMALVAVLLGLAAVVGAAGVPPVVVVLVGLVVVGLDWRRVGRLRVVPFASGFFVVAAVSLERGWAYPAAVVWLVMAIAALWLLQNDERRALARPAPLAAGPAGPEVRSADLVRTLGLALVVGVAVAFLLGRPSCDNSPSPPAPPESFQPGDPTGGSPRRANPGEVPPEYRDGGRAGETGEGNRSETGSGGSGETRTKVDEYGNRYVEDPQTGERYSVTEEGDRSVIRDGDGNVVGEIDENGVVARDGEGGEQRYRTDEQGRLYVESPNGERYYLDESGDGTAVLRDEDGKVVAEPGPDGADDHLVIRDPDGNVLVPDPDGDGEIPVPNSGVRDGLPGSAGDTTYRRDGDTLVATDPDGSTRTYDTDWVGRDRVRVERPGTPTRVFVYDGTGPYRTVIEYDGDGRFVRRYRYDPQGVILDADPSGETYPSGSGQGPAVIPPGGQTDGSAPSQTTTTTRPEAADEDAGQDRSYTWWIIGAALLVAGVAAIVILRRRRSPALVERSLAEALVVRIEDHGKAHGRPRRPAETIVAYTRALSESALPDPRLVDVGQLLSRALFGSTPPSVDRLTQADVVVTEIIE